MTRPHPWCPLDPLPPSKCGVCQCSGAAQKLADISHRNARFREWMVAVQNGHLHLVGGVVADAYAAMIRRFDAIQKEDL